MLPTNFNHLYYFYVIAKEGSITRACEKLLLAQPTLSAQLKQFERSVRRDLFNRHKNRLVLTEEGKALFEYARHIFEIAQEMQDSLERGILKARDTIRIGVVAGMPLPFSKALVQSALKHSHSAHVLLQEGPLEELIKKMEELTLDLLLTETPASPLEGTSLESRHVGKIPIILATNRALAQKFKRQIDRLEQIPVILSATPTQVYTQVRDLLASGKLRPRFVAEVPNVEVARLLAREGLGIAPVNAYSLDKPDRDLVAVKWIIPDPIYENIYLITKKRKYPNPLAVHLLDNFKL